MGRWSVAFFGQVSWQRDKKYLVSLGLVLERKRNEVDSGADKTTLPIIEKISFGGVLSLTEPKTRSGYKGRLFWADAGDLVYSKIRVKQGSLALVPSELGRIAVSAEYPVYRIQEDKAVPEYLALVLKSHTFLSLFEGLSHGGSSKTRIPPDEFERQIIPLPPLAEQRAIVERWRAAQAQIAAATERVEKVRLRIDDDCFASIGFKVAERKTPPRVFAAPWAGFSRWSVSFNQQALTGMNLEAGKYPLANLDSLLTLVQYGTSEKANEQGHGVPVLRIGNIKDRVVDMADLKHIELPVKTLESLLLKDGDMLIIRTSGSRDLVGTCAVFHEDCKAVFASYLIRLRFDTSRVNPDYVCWFLNSALGRQQVDAISRQIMQNNINSEEIRTLRVPLPPLEVQRELVECVTAARAEMARERAAAAQLSQTIAAEVEAMIQGKKL